MDEDVEGKIGKLDQESSEATGHSRPISNVSTRNLRSPKEKHRSGVGLEYSFCWLHTEYCQTKNSFQLCGCVVVRKDAAKCTRKKETVGAQSWITWPTCMALQRTESILPTSADSRRKHVMNARHALLMMAEQGGAYAARARPVPVVACCPLRG